MMFDKSFQEWAALNPKLTIGQWRLLCQDAWERIRASSHWHGGVPCREIPSCESYHER